ncbi:MAG: DUF669 domain-containing protein [Planctomycetaceae bacterium]
MVDLRGYNSDNIEPSRDFEPLPAGKYVAVITESEMKETKSGLGRYLQLLLSIIEGPHRNRTLWVRLNIDNPSRKAKEIAEQQLAAICKALGISKPNDSAELHDLPMTIHVRCKKRPDTNEIVNEVNGFSKRESAASPPPSTGGSSTSSTPPWKR